MITYLSHFQNGLFQNSNVLVRCFLTDIRDTIFNVNVSHFVKEHLYICIATGKFSKNYLC